MAIEKIKISMITGVELDNPYPYYIPQNIGAGNQPTDRVYKNWTVAETYAAWDLLMSEHPTYITKEVSDYKENSGTYDLIRYIFTPEDGYDKTILICAGIHGNEIGGVFSCLRIFQIICEDWQTNAQLSYLRNNVRFVIIPIGNPYGFSFRNMLNADTTGNTGGTGTNPNRNYDSEWRQVMSNGSDYSGSAPFSANESKWVSDTAFAIGLKNIHFMADFHDAPNKTSDHHGDYWINYNTHNSLQRNVIRKLVNYLANKNIGGDADITHTRDSATFGTCADYFNKTLGVVASTVEGCYDTATFDEEFMRLQVETRLNALIIAALSDFKSPSFSSNKAWFKLNYLESCTNKEFNGFSGYKNYANIIELWDELCADYSIYAKKSENYVVDSDGNQVYKYTLSPKKYKKTILIVGGKVYPGNDFHRFSNSIYKFAKLLCMHENEDEHLAYIKNNVRLVFIPYIEYNDNVNEYVDKYGNYNAEGVPNLSQNTTNNLNTIITGIDGLSGVIYSKELRTFSNIILDETTDSKFILASQDLNDSLGVQDYADWLTEQGETVTVEATATSEFANYVFNNQSIPCVRIDTGLDHANWNMHKDDYADATGQVTISLDKHLAYAHETARRIINIVNIIKLMTR